MFNDNARLKLLAVKLAVNGGMAYYRIADMNLVKQGRNSMTEYTGIMEDIGRNNIKDFLTYHVVDGIILNLNNDIIIYKRVVKIPFAYDKGIMLNTWLKQHEKLAPYAVEKFYDKFEFPIFIEDVAYSMLNVTNSSAPEETIDLFLKLNKIKFYKHYTFTSLDKIKKEFDFYLNDCGLAIEYNSSLHRYDSKQKGDQNSAYVSQQYSLKLLEICETYSGYNPVPGDFRICYTANEASAFKFKNMLQQLSNWLNLNYQLNTSVTFYNRSFTDEVYLRSQAFKVDPNKSVAALLLNNVNWNYERNGKITPDIVSANSKRVYWFNTEFGTPYKNTPTHIFTKLKHNDQYSSEHINEENKLIISRQANKNVNENQYVQINKLNKQDNKNISKNQKVMMQTQQIAALRNKGMSYNKLTEYMHMSKATVVARIKTAKELGLIY